MRLQGQKIGLSYEEIGNHYLSQVEFMQKFMVISPCCCDIAGSTEGSGSFSSEVELRTPAPKGQKSDGSAFSFFLTASISKIKKERKKYLL